MKLLLAFAALVCVEGFAPTAAPSMLSRSKVAARRPPPYSPHYWFPLRGVAGVPGRRRGLLRHVRFPPGGPRDHQPQPRLDLTRLYGELWPPPLMDVRCPTCPVSKQGSRGDPVRSLSMWCLFYSIPLCDKTF